MSTVIVTEYVTGWVDPDYPNANGTKGRTTAAGYCRTTWINTRTRNQVEIEPGKRIIVKEAVPQISMVIGGETVIQPAKDAIYNFVVPVCRLETEAECLARRIARTIKSEPSMTPVAGKVIQHIVDHTQLAAKLAEIKAKYP